MPTHDEARPHWVTELSDVEAEEIARKSRVTRQSKRIWDSLIENIRRAIALYTQRHTAERNPVTINPSSDGNNQSCVIRKSTEPVAELRLKFPINDAVILYEQHFSGGQHNKRGGRAEIEIGEAADSPVTYNMNDHSYTEDEFVRETLRDILFTPDLIERAKKFVG
jgi:hypothetical protein